MSAEFRAFAANQSSPVTVWLRSLARLAHGECGQPTIAARDEILSFFTQRLACRA